MPTLHALKRRVPAQDIHSGVSVCVVTMPASDALKNRLALAAFGVDLSARRASLRRVGGVDHAKRSASFFQFVGQQEGELRPTLRQNLTVQACLLPDIAPVFFRRAFGAGAHVFDFQIFERDRAKTAGNAQGRFVLPVLADTRHTGLQSGDAPQLLRPPIRAAFAPRQNPLRPPLAPFDLFEALRHGKHFTRRKRQAIGNAAINPHGGQCAGGRFVRNLATEGHMPAVRLLRHRHILERPAYWARVAEFHKADFREADKAPFSIKPRNATFAPLEAETFIHALFARARVAGASGKKISVGGFKIAQSLLLASLTHRRHKIERGAKRGQFTGLRHVIEALSRRALILPVEVPPLLKRGIIDHAANTGELPEKALLFVRRLELEAKAAKVHIHNIHLGLTDGNMPENADIRRGRHVVYALHAHLVFVTKYRRDALSALAIRDLQKIFAKVCNDFEAELIECDGEDDHVHLLVVYPPKVALSKLVNSLKGVSSRMLRAWRPEVRGRYRRGVLWSPSYFVASCGGAPLSVITEYVRNQRERDALPPRPQGRGFRAKK